MFLRFIVITIFVSFNLQAADCEKPKMPSDEVWNTWLEDIKLEAIQLGITKKTVIKYLKNIKPPYPTIEDGIRGIRFIFAAKKSSELNSKWLKI